MKCWHRQQRARFGARVRLGLGEASLDLEPKQIATESSMLEGEDDGMTLL